MFPRRVHAVTNKTNKQNPQTQTTMWWLPRGGGQERGQGVTDMVAEDLPLGGGHTVQYRGDVSQNCTLETWIILSISVAPINLI